MKQFTKDSLIVASRQELIDIIVEQALHIDTLSNSITEVNVKIEWFKRQIFGGKSERFIPSADLQTALDLGVVSRQDIDKEEEPQTVTYDRKTTAPVKNQYKGTVVVQCPPICP